MGKALIIKGADFSENAVEQILILSDEVKALFSGHNVGEIGMLAFQRFINSIGGLNGTLWGKVGRMYVPMLFEQGTSANDTFFDVKNNVVHAPLHTEYVTPSFANSCLTLTTTAERTTVLPVAIGETESLTSMFGIMDAQLANVGNTIALKSAYNPTWNRGSGNSWLFTQGKTITAGDKVLKIASFGDAVNNSDISHGFIRDDGTVDYEKASLSGSYSDSRIPYLTINPSGGNVSLMIVGYFVGSLTETEVKTVTSALYQMWIDINND